MNDVATYGTLAGLAGVVGAAARTAVLRRPGRHVRAGHAIASDDEQDPLAGVLRHGLGGLTVRVTPGPHGELFLGPGTPEPGRTLRRMALTPLFTRLHHTGGRLWTQQDAPFRLVVEFTGANRDAEALLRAYRMLDQQLRDHAGLLSRCDHGELVPGAVTVTVTGIVDVRELLAAQPVRYAFADGTFDDLGSQSAPPDLVPTISEPWSRRFGWDGQEPIPAEERHLLHALVRSAHQDGRSVRISGLPGASRRARVAIWTELGAAGVDAIADADYRGLARHLRRHPVTRPVEPAPVPARTQRRPTPRPHAPSQPRRHEPV